MAKKRKGAPARTWDEFGNTGDGGLAVLTDEGSAIHRAPPRVTNAIRYLISRALLESAGAPPRRIALTSALRREGVTFVTKSLGAVLAYDHPFTVAVVDVNWWSTRPRPKKGATEPVEEPGIADVIDSGLGLDDIILPTSNPRLSFVPAGEVTISRRPGLARGDELVGVLDDLEKRFDILLLDIPAVRATSDSLDLVRLAEELVFVVHQGVTSEDQVTDAIEDLGMQPLGVILNRYRTSIPKRLVNLFGL